MPSPALKLEVPGNGSNWKNLLQKAKLAISNGVSVTVSPLHIERMPNQPRKYFNPNSIALLGESMESSGQMSAIIIRRVEGKSPILYQLADGERRWLAATAKNLMLRAMLVEANDDVIPFIIAAVANFNRESHTPIEVSDTIERMSQEGLPLKEIANMLGLSMSWAANIHGLQKLDPSVRDMLDPILPKDKMLPVGAAIAISKAEPEIQIGMAKKVLSKRVSLKGLRAQVIKASRKAGAEIRTTRLEPKRLWVSITSLAGQSRRIADDLDLTLGSDNSTTAVSQRSKSEIKKLLDNLDKALDTLRSCRAKIKKNID